MSLVDIGRWVLVVNATLLLLQSLRVISIYSAVYTLTKDKRRQLPLHVWLMALSFFIYVGGTTYYLMVTPAPNTASRVFLYGTAGLIAQYGLWNVLQYDRRRYSRITNFQDSEAEQVRATGQPGYTRGSDGSP